MSYVSILKNIPEIFGQPAGIAALASVGLHGAIAMILPMMPANSKAKDTASAKPVGIVELNQTEQNRLPQTTTASINPGVSLQTPGTLQSQLPNLPTSITPSVNQSQVPPAPPVASTQMILPPLPESTDNIRVASLPQSQSLRIIPRQNLQIDNSFNTRVASYRQLPQGNFRAVPVPRTQPIVTSRLPELATNNVPPDLNTTQSPSNLPPSPPDTAQNPTPSQEFVAPINQTPQTDDRLVLAEPRLPLWQPSPSAVRNLPSSSNQQAIAKATTFGEQFLKVRQQYPNVETKQPISATIQAKAGQESRVEGGLIVNAEGIVDNIEFLDSSVSSETKKTVREYFKDYFQRNPIQANGKVKYFPFSLALSTNAQAPVITPTETKQTPANLIEKLKTPNVNQSPSPEQVKLAPVSPAPNSLVVPAVPVTAQPSLSPTNGNKPQAIPVKPVNSTTTPTTPVRNNLTVQPKQPQATPNPEKSPVEATVETKPVTQVATEETQPRVEKKTSRKILLQKLRQVRQEREEHQNPQSQP